ncbi:MAG TPA: hypothetical protein VK090_01220 [Paracoccaceae bacterium]|nr:hypothetical protein [Paracoccaceae bacterium]
MRVVMSLCVALILGAAPAFAEQGSRTTKVISAPTGKVTPEQIRSGAIIDDGLRIPHIRSGTQYFEIHGSTRIARALGEDRLPTDNAGLNDRQPAALR